MIELSETDEELLELAVLKVPWYMVCGDFHERCGSPGALARRLFELRHAGLLTITPTSPDATTMSAQELESDALANDCHDDVDMDSVSAWDILITQTGFDAIERRLEEQ